MTRALSLSAFATQTYCDTEIAIAHGVSSPVESKGGFFRAHDDRSRTAVVRGGGAEAPHPRGVTVLTREGETNVSNVVD